MSKKLNMNNNGFKRYSINVKSITCDDCEKSFKYNSSLIRHKRAHFEEKPYKCDICD